MQSSSLEDLGGLLNFLCHILSSKLLVRKGPQSVLEFLLCEFQDVFSVNLYGFSHVDIPKYKNQHITAWPYMSSLGSKFHLVQYNSFSGVFRIAALVFWLP